MVGLNGLKGLFQPKWLHESMGKKTTINLPLTTQHIEKFEQLIILSLKCHQYNFFQSG